METLTQDQADFYHGQGYLVLERQLPPDVLSRLHEEIARYETKAARAHRGHRGARPRGQPTGQTIPASAGSSCRIPIPRSSAT